MPPKTRREPDNDQRPNHDKSRRHDHKGPEKFFDAVVYAEPGAADNTRERLTIALHERHYCVARCSEQRAQWHDGVTARMQPIQNSGKRLHCLRAIAAGVVKQNYAAVMPLLFNPAEDDVYAWLCPVLRVNILKDNEIIKLFRDFQWSQVH